MLCFFSAFAWSFDHDHTSLTQLLSNSVVRHGHQTLVNYKLIKKDPSKLNKYIKGLSEITKEEFTSWSRDKQLAVLINGYNAWTIQLIIKHYPVSSIKNIGSLFTSPWEKKFIQWLGDEVSLDYIEHELIRKNYDEPRIHFALVCAAMGCPPLREEAYKASNLNSQLSDASKNFINDKSENRYEIKKDKLILYVSSLFDWYGKDFGSRENLINYITEAMSIKNKIQYKTVTVNFLDYDWSLNEVK
jgi:hypothetical protein